MMTMQTVDEIIRTVERR